MEAVNEIDSPSGCRLDTTAPGKDAGASWKSETGIPVKCAECGVTYSVTRLRPYRHKDHLCAACRGRVGLATAMKGFKTPESTKAERIRANGIVNKRLKLGWFKVPETCAVCGSGGKMHAHHPDYSKPDEVIWTCHADHMRLHHHPELADGIPVMKLDRQTPAPPKHGNGGRKGPTGLAKGKSPLVGVRSVEVDGNQAIEHLACGHAFVRDASLLPAKQRRCPSCPKLPLPSPSHREAVAK